MPTKFTAEIEQAFLDQLAETGNLAESARRIAVSPAQIYRRATLYAGFRAACSEARDAALDRFRAAARQRVVEGTLRPVVYRGSLVQDESGAPVMVRRYSDQLLLHLLHVLEAEQNIANP